MRPDQLRVVLLHLLRPLLELIRLAEADIPRLFILAGLAGDDRTVQQLDALVPVGREGQHVQRLVQLDHACGQQDSDLPKA